MPAEDVESKRAASSLPRPWFLVACCPTNVARTLASLAAYLATADDDGVQLHQYADEPHPHDARRRPPRSALDVATGYPHDGTVTVRVTETDGAPWTLSLRVPPWAAGAELVDPDGRRPAGPGHRRRRAAVRRRATRSRSTCRWRRAGPRPTRGSTPSAAASPSSAGRWCCAPSRSTCPAAATSTRSASIRRCRRATHDGAVVVAAALIDPAATGRGPTATTRDDVRRHDAVEVPLIPYHRWANRGPSTMRVWLPVTD